MSISPRPLKNPPVFPIDKGLVLWLPFDERSGAKAYDRSGKLNHGTLYGPSRVAGRRGSALSFDGTDDHVEVPYSSSVWGFSQFTLMGWVKADVIQNSRIMENYEGQVNPEGGREDVTITIYGGKWYFELVIDGASMPIHLGSPSAGVWYHIVAVWTGAEMRLYENAVLLGTAAKTGVINSTGNKWRIGHAWGLNYFDGIIDEVRIYKRALTAVEIKRHYESEILLVKG